MLVYVGGFGRSGSTLLECMLTTNSAVVGLGEVGSASANSAHKGTKALTCSCGAAPDDCAVWHGHVHNFGDAPRRWDHADLTMALLQRASKDWPVAVDSSKTAWGSAFAPFALRRRLGTDFRMAHIVRNPMAVSWSQLNMHERHGTSAATSVSLGPLLSCAKTASGWVIANLICELFGSMYPRQYVRVHYEELASNPRDVLNGLFDKLLPDAQRAARSGSANNRHQLYGNRMRRQQFALSDVRYDARWADQMPFKLRWPVVLIAWPLMAMYGYGLTSALTMGRGGAEPA
jgi:hypothetical protein